MLQSTSGDFENYKLSIYKELQSNLKRSQFLKKKDNQRFKSILNAKLNFENGPRLAIIKPCLTKEEQNSTILSDGSTQISISRDLNENNSMQSNIECQNNKSLVIKILNAISALSDNQQKSKIIKHFLSISTNFYKYERMRFIEKFLSKELIQYIQTKYSLDIFKQLNDSYKMQLDQQISNVLFFEASIESSMESLFETKNQVTYNSSFLASQLMLLHSSKTYQNSTKQRMIFLNLTGIKNNDAELHNLYSKNECLYISLQRKNNRNFQTPNKMLSPNESNFKIIYLEENQEEVTWQQFRIIYKYQIKKQIKNFKSNLFILSIAKRLDCQSYFKFTEHCILKMISKFSILAKDKLIIHSYISQSLYFESQNQEAKQAQEAQDAELICYINSLQQGILSQEIFLTQDNAEMQTDSTELRRFDNWVENLVQGNTKFLKAEQQELIQRERRNKKLDSKFELVKDPSSIKLGVYIFNAQDKSQFDQIIYLTYDKKYLQFFTNSILHVDYIGKQIVLLQYEEPIYYVYYTEFQNKFQNTSSNILNCKRINLSELLKQQENLDELLILNSSLIVKDRKVYIVYNKDASKIFVIQLNNSSAIVLKRRNLKSEKIMSSNQEKLQSLFHQSQEEVEKITYQSQEKLQKIIHQSQEKVEKIKDEEKISKLIHQSSEEVEEIKYQEKLSKLIHLGSEAFEKIKYEHKKKLYLITDFGWKDVVAMQQEKPLVRTPVYDSQQLFNQSSGEVKEIMYQDKLSELIQQSRKEIEERKNKEMRSELIQQCQKEAQEIKFIDKFSTLFYQSFVEFEKIMSQYKENLQKLIHESQEQVEKIKLSKLIRYSQEQVEKIVQNRRKPTIVQHPCVSGFDFIIFGGEFVKSNKFCNLVELLQIESESFSSMIISKDILFQKCGYYIPWPNMIVLVNTTQPKQYILLPGDYNNKNYCYNQVINKEHQEKAILITSGQDSLQFQFEYLKIEYKIELDEKSSQKMEQDEKIIKNRKPVPIQYFSGSQTNIKGPMNLKQKWHIAITMLENVYSKIVQLFVLAEIEIDNEIKQLKITQSFKEIVDDKKIVTCNPNRQVN